MKKAFGALESLIVIILLIMLWMILSDGNNPVKTFVNERVHIKNNQELIKDKLNQLERAKQYQEMKFQKESENY